MRLIQKFQNFDWGQVTLSQIIMNLVSNALKFTKDGKVVVSCDLDRVEGTRHFIQFKVKDNGVGIAKENQEKIFEKFVQIERKEEDYQGNRIGIVYCVEFGRIIRE